MSKEKLEKIEASLRQIKGQMALIKGESHQKREPQYMNPDLVLKVTEGALLETKKLFLQQEKELTREKKFRDNLSASLPSNEILANWGTGARAFVQNVKRLLKEAPE